MSEIIGLVGAHRVGKTYLRDHLTTVLGAKKFDFSISKEQRYLGYQSGNQSYKPHERRHIQARLLKQMTSHLRHAADPIISLGRVDEHKHHLVIADRTPIDLIGYALINLVNDPWKDSKQWQAEYIQECISVTNIYFKKLVLIQPGILFIPDNKSGPVEMVDDLNAIYASMFLRPELGVDRRIMPETMTDITERMKYVLEFINA